MNATIQLQLAEEAKIHPPIWTGDLKDDCTSRWGGLLLRSEWMDGRIWWWAVTEITSNLEIDSSNNHDLTVDSGAFVRRLAEGAACDWLGISANYSNG